MRVLNWQIVIGTLVMLLWGIMPLWGQESTGFEVTSIVVSKNCVETQDFETRFLAMDNPDCPKRGDNQLIQVSVENRSPSPRNINILLDIQLDGKRVKRHGEIRSLPSSGEYRMLYSYKIPDKGGRYHLSAQVLDAKSKRVLVKSAPGVEREFYILRQSDVELTADREEEKRIEEEKREPQKLEFDPPDLRWDNIYVVPKHVLRGERFRIRLDLVNVGGDIVRGIDTQVDFFNVRLPRRRTRVAEKKAQVLAPGETTTFEMEYTFPEDELLGNYQIIAVADPKNIIDEGEGKEDNNQILSDVILLSDIKIIIPTDGHQFDETGLFLFRWDSLLFHEFKLQIGIDDKFSGPPNSFDLPSGERWIAENEFVPFAGELPKFGLGLMKTHSKSILYWRVVGRKSDGTETTSGVRTFTIVQNNPES
ncbi:MAG: hypothetical protein HQM13_15900 [SAR324 cluster bacterium]|nr:hypothetical protein [SAR324 cluster bacterium]